MLLYIGSFKVSFKGIETCYMEMPTCHQQLNSVFQYFSGTFTVTYIFLLHFPSTNLLSLTHSIKLHQNVRGIHWCIDHLGIKTRIRWETCKTQLSHVWLCDRCSIALYHRAGVSAERCPGDRIDSLPHTEVAPEYYGMIQRVLQSHVTYCSLLPSSPCT